MRRVLLCFLVLCGLAFSQTTTTQTAFTTTSISFNLSPITLPGVGQTLSGAETDALIHFTTNNIFGETTLISTEPFIGGRYEHVFPSIAKYLQNHTSLTGGNFQAGLTASLGVVKSTKPHWGERAGIFLKYAPAGSTNFDLGIDVEWNNLPDVARHAPSFAIGPDFRFGN